jgi:uncharacterized membrane protein affecting hemolysin expression
MPQLNSIKVIIFILLLTHLILEFVWLFYTVYFGNGNTSVLNKTSRFVDTLSKSHITQIANNLAEIARNSLSSGINNMSTLLNMTNDLIHNNNSSSIRPQLSFSPLVQQPAGE